jgi:DNA-binding transcriptional MerR regulator
MASIDMSLFASIDDSKKEKSPNALRTISEASEVLDVPQHVLRFWETKFNQIKPLKRNGGRRFYRPQDLDVLQQIKHLLYNQGYTIKGAKKAVDEFIHARGEKGVSSNEWIAQVPVASVNDNFIPEMPTMADVPDMLAELALALKEAPQAVVAEIAVADNTARREELTALRSELVEARNRLVMVLPAKAA